MKTTPLWLLAFTILTFTFGFWVYDARISALEWKLATPEQRCVIKGGVNTSNSFEREIIEVGVHCSIFHPNCKLPPVPEYTQYCVADNTKYTLINNEWVTTESKTLK